MNPIKGFWERNGSYLKVHIIVNNSVGNEIIEVWNQNRYMGKFLIPKTLERIHCTLLLEDSQLESYYLMLKRPREDKRLLIDRLEIKNNKLTLDASQQIGKTIVSISKTILDQIDGLLASL